MKHILIVFLVCIFLATTFAGCDKVQQATDAIDKAKTFSDDLQKKVKGIIPGSDQKAGDSEKGGAGDKGRRIKKARKRRMIDEWPSSMPARFVKKTVKAAIRFGGSNG